MGTTYRKVELVGTSPDSFEEAINNALATANNDLPGLAWFEVVEQHGKIEGGKVSSFQVVMKVGFTLD